ncbi:hypothetical protein [Niabella aurantiaca]|uniref:hypothetical protein n=1 Tax=Niabella aurantiaca TaxID=379900 RepID=UPI000378CCF6|nr:hypothetical protein [Niabella aurantiaca]
MKTEILSIRINEPARRILAAQKNSNLVEVSTAEAAVEKFQLIDFDVVVAPENYLAPHEEAMLKKLLSLNDHDSMWITYQNGREAGLEKEITGFLTELETAPRHSFSIADDGLKPRGLQIEIL